MDTVYNRITVTFRHIPRITGPEILYQEDVTQILVIQGLDLPEYFVVDFCNEGDMSVVPITGTAEGVEIPDALLATGKTVKAYIVVSAGEGDVETRYEIKLPVRIRPSRGDIDPTPAQQQQIDALVANLNDGVSRAESAADTATQAAQLLQNPSAEATTLEAGSEATASYEDGTFSFGIPKGPKGDPMTYEDMTEEQKAELVQGPILEAQTAGVRAVNDAGTAKVSQINQAGTTNVNAVNQAGTTQVGNVNQAGTTQVGNVNEAGATQVQAVTDKGAEVRDSIPADYTALDAKVTSLNQAINVFDGQVNDSTTGLDTKAPAIINTASGAIASFADGSDSIPVKKLVVGVEPQQDLHGYENPWPAGGGENLLPPMDSATSNGVTITVADDGTITINGTASADTYFDKKFDAFMAQGQVFYISAFNPSASSSNKLSVFIVGTGGYPQVNLNNANAVYSTNSSADSTLSKWRLRVPSGVTYTNFVLKPMFQIGGTAPTQYSPYSNICPISGWTGAEIYDDPKYGGFIKWNQLFNQTLYRSSGTVSHGLTITNNETYVTVSGINTEAYGQVASNITFNRIEGHKYLIDVPTLPSNLNGYTLIVSTEAFYNLPLANASNGAVIAIAKTSGTDNCVYARISDSSHSYQFSNFKYYINIYDLTEMFGAGNEPTVEEFKALFPKDYYQYQAEPTRTLVSAVNGYPYQSVSVTFPSSAGTVYGGTLTINPDRTGTLVVDKRYITIDENTGIGKESTGLAQNYEAFYLNIVGNNGKTIAVSSIPYIVSNQLESVSYNTLRGSNAKAFCVTFTASGAFIEWLSTSATVEEEKARITNNPIEVCYELATPITYTLTATEIDGILTTLYGTNNIWADCGDTSVTYAADTKLSIEHLTQPTEDDMTADHAISAGTFFMLGNTLYIATSQIAAGATITPGTNATQLSLADALNQLNT